MLPTTWLGQSRNIQFCCLLLGKLQEGVLIETKHLIMAKFAEIHNVWFRGIAKLFSHKKTLGRGVHIYGHVLEDAIKMITMERIQAC